MSTLPHRLQACIFAIVTLSCALTATAADEHPATKPAGDKDPAPRVYTYHDFYRDVLEYHRQTLIEPYKKLGRRDPKWDAQALAYLEVVAQQFSFGSVPRLYQPEGSLAIRPHALELGKTLIDAGCDDPVVLYCHAANLIDTQKAKQGQPLLRKAVEGLRAKKYPAYCLAIAEDRLFNQSNDPDEKKKAKESGQAAWLNAFSGKHSGAERRFVVEARWAKLSDRAQQKAFVDAVSARQDADPWMKGVITGRLETQLAWDSRGNGFANTVTEEGWKGFFKHLALARDALAGAYAAAPNLPEPSADMITVAMGGSDELKENPSDWFELATKAQLDYRHAYYSMMVGPLLPRWGGSYQQMIDFADACVAQPRFDTLIPMVYLEVVERIGIDSKQPWSSLSTAKVYNQIVKVTEGYAATVNKKKAVYYKSLHVAVACRANRLADARKVLDEMTAAGMTMDPVAFAYFSVPNNADTVSSIYARSGPHAAKLAEAESQAANGDLAAAVAGMKAIVGQVAKDEPAQPFLAQRLFQVEQQMQFVAGEWSAMQMKGNLSGWSKRAGMWSADAAGAIIGHCDPHNAKNVWSFLDWVGKDNGRDPGRSFELSGVIEFPAGPSDLKYTDGAFELATTGEKGPKAIVVDFNQKAGRVDIFVESERVLIPARFHSGSRFVMRVSDQKLSVQIDDKMVKDRYPLPDGWEGDLKLSIAVCGPNPTKFKDLKIRKAPPAADAKQK